MNYSIFHAVGSAGNVRGKQVAEWLGAKLNPTEGYLDDLCIYVKVLPPDIHSKHTYLDVDDSTTAVKWLLNHTDTGIIVNSPSGKEYLSNLLDRDDVIVIPHAHCNYENWIRPEREVKTVGIIGSRTSFMYPLDQVRDELKEIGLELIYEKDYWKNYGDEEGMSEDDRRKKIVEFYKKVDIQIVWRPDDTFSPQTIPLKNPNKLVNASSFGIPTIAYPEKAFSSWYGDYIDVKKIDHMIWWCKKLKENSMIYNSYGMSAINHAKQYYVDKIKQLYKDLI